MTSTRRLRYNVIWIDDKWKEFDDFIINAAGKDIHIEPYEYGKDALDELDAHIDIWDGVILDVKCWYEPGEVDDAENFYKVREKLQMIKMAKRKDLPFFVYSAQPDYLSDDTFLKSLNGKKLYEKAADDDALLSDIIIEADRLLETQIRHKYLDFVPFSELHKELLETLTFVETNVTDVPDPIEKCRLTLNWVMRYLNECGLLPIEHNGSNLSECSVFLGNKEMAPFVPLYIQRSFHSCVEISNNGSHREEVFNAIRSGKAPFLVRSTVFDLLNILQWCATLPTDSESRERLKKEVSKIQLSYAFYGSVEKDEFGNFHCGNCLITYTQMKELNLSEEDGVGIRTTRTNNKKSNRNPYDVVAATIDKL